MFVPRVHFLVIANMQWWGKFDTVYIVTDVITNCREACIHSVDNVGTSLTKDKQFYWWNTNLLQAVI